MVRAAAPEAEEKISYQMPAFRLKGDLIYFAALQEAHRDLSAGRGGRAAPQGPRALPR